MTNNPDISVREIQITDIERLADYWFQSDSEYLRSLGADKDKLPARYEFVKTLTEQISLPFKHKNSYALIWQLDGKPIGHSNVNNIQFAMEATMHLHLWKSDIRKRGLGTELVKKSLSYYFRNLNLKKLICEPYALNPAPNKTLEKTGFDFVRKYRTIPGSINFEQEVNRWELTKDKYEKIMNSDNT
jgi:RimJ/RimL family protein N-acetyltransferase